MADTKMNGCVIYKCEIAKECAEKYKGDNPPCALVAQNSTSTNKSSPKLPDELIILTDAYLLNKRDALGVADDILCKWQAYYNRVDMVEIPPSCSECILFRECVAFRVSDVCHMSLTAALRQ
ncbi:MAG TPA: hypothetical protein VMV56_07285 [Williamwhitmania sp.]|nr:hypothetical protein [Williamwhitmania sp.]